MARPALLILILFTYGGIQAQENTGPSPADSVTVVPAEYCQAGPLFSALAGQGYRDLWAQPITVPVANLDSLGGGGLTPMRLGGGMTTQTLHLRGADGRRYVFRSVRKTTRQALAEEYWGTPVEAIMRDQLCSFHPSGAVVVAPLLEAVGVLHPEPRLLVVPDDPRLEEFRDQFAGMFVLFEERPDDLPDGEAGFAGSRQIVQTDDLFDELEDDAEERLDAEEFLRSRLVDLLVGDRDRSINNHLWARFDREGGGHLWRPIPRDRDQAFVRFDGLLKTVGRSYEPRLVAFRERYSSIQGLTRNAWDLDRNLLVGLSRERWEAVVEEVASALTDQVIGEAVRRMPPEHVALVGAELEAGLRQRRDQLPEAARELYEIVFRNADVHATDEDEVALIQRSGDGSLTISLHRPGADGQPGEAAHFLRTFAPSETDEIRLYLHGGDDRVQITGEGPSEIILRIVGGGGQDELRGVGSGEHVRFYDDGSATEMDHPGVRWIPRDASRPYSWWEEGESPPDFGYRRWPRVAVSYDSDRGLVAGFGFQWDHYGFLHQPFQSRLQIEGGWAVARSQPLLDYRHLIRDALMSVDFQLHARYSGFEVVRFYGLGNETEVQGPQSFYEVHQKQLAVEPSVTLGGGSRHQVSLGPVFRRTQSDTVSPGTFVTERRAYGTGTFEQAGVQLSFDLDGRDLPNFPTRGYHLRGGASLFPSTLDVTSTFGEVHGEASAYVSPSSQNPILALRVGGKHLWGVYPYSDAAFLGGKENVRGLREQRYAGDATVYGNAEVRVFLGRFLFLVPVDFGVFGLADLGRVFVEGEGSGEWYTSRGGGLWMAPIKRSATLFFAAAESRGHWEFSGGMGFAF